MTYPTFRGSRPQEVAEPADTGRRCPRCQCFMRDVPNTSAHAKLCTDCKDVLPRKEWHHWGYSNIMEKRAREQAIITERRAQEEAKKPILCPRCNAEMERIARLCQECRANTTGEERIAWGYSKLTNKEVLRARRKRLQEEREAEGASLAAA